MLMTVQESSRCQNLQQKDIFIWTEMKNNARSFSWPLAPIHPWSQKYNMLLLFKKTTTSFDIGLVQLSFTQTLITRQNTGNSLVISQILCSFLRYVAISTFNHETSDWRNLTLINKHKKRAYTCSRLNFFSLFLIYSMRFMHIQVWFF